jgi:hypothetical protein
MPTKQNWPKPHSYIGTKFPRRLSNFLNSKYEQSHKMPIFQIHKISKKLAPPESSGS